jgi:subtilisin-like proprotein convertase family protein
MKKASFIVLQIICFIFIPVVTSTATFDGTNLGDIVDSLSAQPQCQNPGPPRDVRFNVTGLTGNVQTVAVSLTIEHSWVGDLVATLIAPGFERELDLFGYTGATVGPGTNASAGDSSDLGAQYTFSDAANASWWAAVAAVSFETPIPGGTYRTSQRGGPSATGANTSLNTTFDGLTPAQANGTWILRVSDGCGGDSGIVTAATLDITTMGTTAASVSVSGRVLTNGKRGLSNALVYLTDSSGGTRTARTNSLGYYRFNDIAAGQSVTITVVSKRYQFAPQIVNVNEEMSGLNFLAEQ